METQLEMFQEFEKMEEVPADQVTIQEVEKLIREYREARDNYDAAKKVSNELEAKSWDFEMKVMSMLEKLGRKSFDVEGVGKVTKCMKLVYSVPKTHEEKLALFDYIKNAHGADVLTTMTTINHQTLNSWANKEIETGEISKIPGLDSPTSQEYLQLRREK